jgi:hypothetical protein
MSAWLERKKNWLGKKDHQREDPPAEAPKADGDKSEDFVEYYVVKCPRCQSEKTKIYKHDRPIRYHKCQDCGHNFKSIERSA